MTTSEQLDLSVLPEDARKELRDFYHLLVERYRVADSKDNEEQTLRFAKFLQKPWVFWVLPGGGVRSSKTSQNGRFGGAYQTFPALWQATRGKWPCCTLRNPGEPKPFEVETLTTYPREVLHER